MLLFLYPCACRESLCLGDEREEIHDRKSDEYDDGRGDEPVSHVVEEGESEPSDAPRLLGHYEVRHTPEEGDVAGESGEPCQEEADDGDGAGHLALARGAHEVGDLLDDQDGHGDVTKDLTTDDDEHGEEDDSAHGLEVHRGSDGEEDDARDARVLEPLQPVEQTHEHEEDSPVHLSDGVESILLVEAGVDHHEEDASTERDYAEVEVGGDGWRWRDG